MVAPREHRRGDRLPARDHPGLVDLALWRRVEARHGELGGSAGLDAEHELLPPAPAREADRQPDRERSARGRRNRDPGVQASPPRAQRDDLRRLLAGGVDDAFAQLQRWRRPLIRIGERLHGVAEGRQLRAAVFAVAQVGLEGRALLVVERVQRVGSAQIVQLVVRHLMPFAGIRRGRQSGSTYSRGGFWTLCSVAYSFVSRLISSASPYA